MQLLVFNVIQLNQINFYLLMVNTVCHFAQQIIMQTQRLISTRLVEIVQ